MRTERLCSLVGDELFFTLQSISHIRIIETLRQIYYYLHGRCSGELYSLDSAKTRTEKHIVANHLHPLRTNLVNMSVPLGDLLPTKPYWDTRLPIDCFHIHTNLNLFKSRFICYLPPGTLLYYSLHGRSSGELHYWCSPQSFHEPDKAQNGLLLTYMLRSFPVIFSSYECVQRCLCSLVGD